MHDGVDPANKLIHADDLLQVLLCQLQDLQDVQTKKIVPGTRRSVKNISIISKEHFDNLSANELIRKE